MSYKDRFNKLVELAEGEDWGPDVVSEVLGCPLDYARKLVKDYEENVLKLPEFSGRR